MEILEREQYIDDLLEGFQRVKKEGGHAVFIRGEPGIGKTSLINLLLEKLSGKAKIFAGSCDSLFTPRALGPVFDMARQIGSDFLTLLKTEKDRSAIFESLLENISGVHQPIIMIFEDIHWADEATLDLIKFLTKRINKYKCLFLLTYRSNEVNFNHPLSGIFGDLPSTHYSKIELKQFSKATVNTLALEKGFGGHQLYELTGGNPFYVMEVLKNNGLSIPEQVKDLVLAVFKSQDQKTRAFLELLSVIPTKIEVAIAKHIAKETPEVLDGCLHAGLLLLTEDHIIFKHELFRLAIEESLPYSKRIQLNKEVLKALLEATWVPLNLSRVVHHAKIAGEQKLIEEFAPKAAFESAQIGAHREAAILFHLAIEYSQVADTKELASLYNHHAFECFLTFQIQEAIDSQKKALEIWHNHEVVLKHGDSLRFLSLLMWYYGEKANAMTQAHNAIEILEKGFPSRERALAYCNLAQLYLLMDDKDKAIEWGRSTEVLAEKLEDNTLKCEALNIIGTAVLCRALNSDADILFEQTESGLWSESHLARSLELAHQNGLQIQAARAFINLACLFVYSRNFNKAEAVFNAGLKHFDEHDLWSWKYYMISLKIRALLESCRWKEAEVLANELQTNSNYSRLVTIECNTIVECATSLAKLKIRQGKFEEAKKLLAEARADSIHKKELHRAVPILTAELELAWLTGSEYPLDTIKDVGSLYKGHENSWHFSNLKYWLKKCDISNDPMPDVEFFKPVRYELEGKWQYAAKLWEEKECFYEQALALLEGDKESKMRGLELLVKIGAVATAARYRGALKNLGVKNIPRGPHSSTRDNLAQLTRRQIQILTLLQTKLPNRAIAEKLFISPKTVDNHISAIFVQLGVSSRPEAVQEAVKLGILKKYL